VRLAQAHDFARAAHEALECCDFSAPAGGEACVLVFDSSAWATQVPSAETLLDTGERTRAARFHFEHDRTTYILAHAMWRTVLGVCLESEASRVPLTSTLAGQPRLAGTGLATSLSHSGRWVAIAACTAATTGVDIECTPPRMALEQLMPTICTAGEIAELGHLPASSWEPALLALWTRKEALLKAFGVGLGVDPSLLSAIPGELVASPSPAEDMAACRVRNLDLPAGLVGALAVPESIRATRLYVPGQG
jgi:4'-phosphopantetheinyl transferase